MRIISRNEIARTFQDFVCISSWYDRYITCVFDISCFIFTTCTLLGRVYATIADRCELALAKVDAVDCVAQVIANVIPHVAHAYN